MIDFVEGVDCIVDFKVLFVGDDVVCIGFECDFYEVVFGCVFFCDEELVGVEKLKCYCIVVGEIVVVMCKNCVYVLCGVLFVVGCGFYDEGDVVGVVVFVDGFFEYNVGKFVGVFFDCVVDVIDWYVGFVGFEE